MFKQSKYDPENIIHYKIPNFRWWSPCKTTDIVSLQFEKILMLNGVRLRSPVTATVHSKPKKLNLQKRELRVHKCSGWTKVSLGISKFSLNFQKIFTKQPKKLLDRITIIFKLQTAPQSIIRPPSWGVQKGFKPICFYYSTKNPSPSLGAKTCRPAGGIVAWI